MWKLLAIGLSVLQTVQAIPRHPVFFRHQDRLSAEAEFGSSTLAGVSGSGSIVYAENVTVCFKSPRIISIATPTITL